MILAFKLETQRKLSKVLAQRDGEKRNEEKGRGAIGFFGNKPWGIFGDILCIYKLKINKKQPNLKNLQENVPVGLQVFTSASLYISYISKFLQWLYSFII